MNITYNEALSILDKVARLGRARFGELTERVAIENGIGRLSARAIASSEAIPPFDNSSMDGFTVRAHETVGASRARPLRLSVLGSIAAGDAPRLTNGEPGALCWEIMTGAPIPASFDAVAKVEDVEVVRDAAGLPREVVLTAPLEPRENFRGRGLDFEVGSHVLSQGDRIMPEQVMALASLGIAELEVLRRPRVALIATGSELASHTERQLAPGQIRNSTTPHLLTALPLYGAECKLYGTSPDDPAVFRELLDAALDDQPDVLITTGAVSRGKHDFVPAALAEAGAQVLFHQVSIRPGKPGYFGQFEGGGPVVFGIPGNPVSTAVALRFFVSRYLEALTGVAAERPLTARLVANADKPKGLRCFFKAQVRSTNAGLEVLCLGGQPSFMVSPMLESNAWVVFPEEGDLVAEGTVVEIYPLHKLPYSFGDGFPEAGKASRAKGCC